MEEVDERLKNIRKFRNSDVVVLDQNAHQNTEDMLGYTIFRKWFFKITILTKNNADVHMVAATATYRPYPHKHLHHRNECNSALQ